MEAYDCLDEAVTLLSATSLEEVGVVVIAGIDYGSVGGSGRGGTYLGVGITLNGCGSERTGGSGGCTWPKC